MRPEPRGMERPQLWEHEVVETLDLEHTVGDHERVGWEVAGIAAHEAVNMSLAAQCGVAAASIRTWTVVFKRRLE